MRSSGSPGSWPPSAAEFRCVSLTLRSNPKTSNLFPEFDSMFMVANWTFLTSHAPAGGRIGAPPARAGASAPRPFPPGLLQPPRGPADPRQHPPLPPGRLDLLADRHPPIVPAAFRKLDAVAVLTGPSLPVPRLAAVRDPYSPRCRAVARRGDRHGRGGRAAGGAPGGAPAFGSLPPTTTRMRCVFTSAAGFASSRCIAVPLIAAAPI
jgi:hypothetical protein